MRLLPGFVIWLTISVLALLSAQPRGSQIQLNPQTSTVALGSGEFCLAVDVLNVFGLGEFSFTLGFPPALLQATDATIGDFLGSTGRTVTPVGPSIDNSAGTLTFGATSAGTQPGPGGDGALASVCFTPAAVGDALLTFPASQFADTGGNPLLVIASGGQVTIVEPTCYGADLDCDGDVDLDDIELVAGHWGTATGEPGYDPALDFDEDGDVDVFDVQLIAAEWGWPANDPTAGGRSPREPLVFALAPEELQLRPGEVVTVTLGAQDAASLAAFEAVVTYDPAQVQVGSAALTPFLAGTGRSIVPLGPVVDPQNGTVRVGAATYGAAAGVTGDGALVTMAVTALAPGTGVLDLSGSQAADPAAAAQPVTEGNATYAIAYQVYLPVLINRQR